MNCMKRMRHSFQYRKINYFTWDFEVNLSVARRLTLNLNKFVAYFPASSSFYVDKRFLFVDLLLS